MQKPATKPASQPASNAIETAIEGAALAPIGPRETRDLAILCRKAWDKLGRPGLVEGGTIAAAFDAWRHLQILQCCERGGLRQCRLEDYNYIKAHMHRILGATRQADHAQERAQSERRRQAIARLREEYRLATHIASPVAYVHAIARVKFKTTYIETDLTANQLWQLIFSLRNANTRKSRANKTP